MEKTTKTLGEQCNDSKKVVTGLQLVKICNQKSYSSMYSTVVGVTASGSIGRFMSLRGWRADALGLLEVSDRLSLGLGRLLWHMDMP